MIQQNIIKIKFSKQFNMFVENDQEYKSYWSKALLILNAEVIKYLNFIQAER